MLKKSSKRFVLSSDAKNEHGFRVDTAGIDFSDYDKNPLMLFMHKRPKGERKDEVLPLGNFVELEVKEGKLYATPAFDTTDTFAVAIMNKVENGTIRMASAGLLPLEWEIRDGEKWLAKSKLVEGTICDIGSNPEALAVVLYDRSDKLITLSEEYFKQVFNQKTQADMKLIQLKASDLAKRLSLATEEPTEAEVMTRVDELVQLNSTHESKIVQLQSQLSAESEKAQKAENDLAALKAEKVENEAVELVNKAIEERKITADQKDHLVKLAKVDLDGTKAYLETLQAVPTAKYLLDANKSKPGEEMINLSWEELDKQGLLVQLQSENPEVFKVKYKERFKKEWAG